MSKELLREMRVVNGFDSGEASMQIRDPIVNRQCMDLFSDARCSNIDCSVATLLCLIKNKICSEIEPKSYANVYPFL